MELDLLWGKKLKNMAKCWESGVWSSHSRTLSGGRSHLAWPGAPQSAHPAASLSLPLGPPAPAHLISPRRREGLAAAPQLRELTPQVWEPRGDLLSGECGCRSQSMWAGPSEDAMGEGKDGVEGVPQPLLPYLGSPTAL